MKSLDWNPTFGPVFTAIIVLAAGFYFAMLLPRLVARHGRGNAWMLLLPKMLIVALVVTALLDPTFKFAGGNAKPAKVLVLEDISSSMDLKDDPAGSRRQRAETIIKQLEANSPASIHFVLLPFDTALHEEGYVPKTDEERGTDLSAPLIALSTQANLADADGAIVLTDGGDETVELANLPTLPLAVIGVGSSPDTWNDVGIGAVTAPASVEEKSQFDLEANVYARPQTHAGLTAVKVGLEEGHDKMWTEVQSKTVDLSSLHAAAVFRVQVNGTGTQRYRVHLQQLPDELTVANNTRVVSVEVQQRAMHVLYYTQELGVDYKYLRTELGADPGVVFTAMYRVLEDQFTVQGDRTGYQDLAQGFPSKDGVLKRYDCVILGSFTADQFTDAQQQAVLNFVQNGGALILLGGESSFGRGGYADSKMAPLMPWTISKAEPELLRGSFPVTLAASGATVGFTSGMQEDMSASGGVSLDSLNQPGGLRPGAIALFEAAISSGTNPVVAWQRYGKGQVIGVATNTMWKWAAAGAQTKSLYGRFWRQAVRGVTTKLEGGSMLGIHWNKDHYRPGEQAVVEVHLRSGSSNSGAIRLVGALSGPDGDHDVTLTPVVGQADLYSGKIPLPKRGDYTFHLSAYSGSSVAESYERVLPVFPLLEEAASPELKEAYLKDIAARASGLYAHESAIEPVQTFLRQQIIAQETEVALPLVNFWNIFPILIIVLLVVEWLLRRRLNLI